MKRNITTIICCNAEDMNRKADSFILKGYMVEREELYLHSLGKMAPIYRLSLWKEKNEKKIG